MEGGFYKKISLWHTMGSGSEYAVGFARSDTIFESMCCKFDWLKFGYYQILLKGGLF